MISFFKKNRKKIISIKMIIYFILLILFCILCCIYIYPLILLTPMKDYDESLVDHLSTISELSHKNRAYIFPRNGFLLGVIRHNGFLPNEKIDVDLACLEKHIPIILNSDWGDYNIISEKKWSNSWDTDFTDGKHPKTGKQYEYHKLKIKHKYSNFQQDVMIFYDLDLDNYFYPLFTIKNMNSENEFKLNTEIYKTNSMGIVYKNKILPLIQLYNNKEYLGKVGAIYKKNKFIDFYPEKFYNKKIYVPIGSRDILYIDYGYDVFRTIINKDGKRKNIYFSFEHL